MKILKKILSVLMASVIMISGVTVNASAEKKKISPPTVEVYRSGNYTYTYFTIPENLMDTYLEKYEEDNSARFYLELETSLVTCSVMLYDGSQFLYSTETFGECVPTNKYKASGGMAKYGFGVMFKFKNSLSCAERLMMAESGKFTYYLSYSNDQRISYGSRTPKEIKLDGNDTHFLNTDIADMWVDKISDKKYKNEKITPSVKVTNHLEMLKEGVDYTLSYKNNKKVGTATVTIKGKGKYSGTKKVTFDIVPEKTTLTAAKKSDNKVTFKWDKALGAGKYQIYYSENNGMYKKLASVKGSKTSYTTSKLDFSKNDYKFVIRTGKTVDGKTYYSAFSKEITVE